jgi:hypothetical protein
VRRDVMNRFAVAASVVALTLMPASVWAQTATATATPTITPINTPTGTPTFTPTSCGGEFVAVNPVISPTDLLEQTITGSARVTGARYLAIFSEAISYSYLDCGTVPQACGYSFAVPLPLLPNRTNHITVCNGNAGCGGGVCTRVDVYGNPLDIVQISDSPTPTPTPTPANAPPDCSSAGASPALLWPPQHKFVTVSIAGVTDPEGDPVSIMVSGISQDEPLLGSGTGNTCPDASGIGTSVASLRAERSGLATANGRVYHVTFTADDGKGGQCTGQVLVCVPRDQLPGPGHLLCIDEGPLMNSTGACP